MFILDLLIDASFVILPFLKIFMNNKAVNNLKIF